MYYYICVFCRNIVVRRISIERYEARKISLWLSDNKISYLNRFDVVFGYAMNGSCNLFNNLISWISFLDLHEYGSAPSES